MALTETQQGDASAASLAATVLDEDDAREQAQKRVPIVGWASLAFGFFVFMSGLAVSAFMLFWTRFATGIAKANSIPVHQSLIADNYPIGIRARMSAAINMGGHGIGLVSPVLCA